jgi:hypothetical protein
MKNLPIKLRELWNIPLVSRAVHTLWQAGLAAFVVSLTAAHDQTNVKLVLIAAIGAGLSATKTMFVAYVKGLKA